MSSKSLCKIVRAADIAVLICGLIICGYFLPAAGTSLAGEFPEFAHFYWPWLTFLWLAAAPCFVILALMWKVAAAIKRERVFTFQTARLVKTGSLVMFCDVGFFFAGNMVLGAFGAQHPGLVIFALFACVLGVALALAAAVLSRYLTKAAELQEEVDGTI